ncbi:MAG: diamine N-acetyltransferase [Cellvibrionaceae bacterium]|jgi:diamine N-acetyltransferase
MTQTSVPNNLTNNGAVSLRKVTSGTLRSVLNLKVAPHQENFVSPNAVSIAEAYFEEKAWFRAVYAGETPIGFVMTFEDPEKSFYYLWRYMIAAEHQGKGYGAQALQLVIDHIKSQSNAAEMVLSVVPAEGGAIPFYKKFGFADTGEVDEGEMVFKLVF